MLEIDRERGFIVLHRRIQSSPVWKALRGEQRSVLISILFLANWKPSVYMHRASGTVVEVDRGELTYSYEKISDHAAVSVAVVRSAIKKMLNPKFGFLSLKTRLGGQGGTLHLRVDNYDRYQSLKDDESDDLARSSHGVNTGVTAGSHGGRTGVAPLEPDKPREPVEPIEPKNLLRGAEALPASLHADPPVSVPGPNGSISLFPDDAPVGPITPLMACLQEKFPQIKNGSECESAWRDAYPGVDLVSETMKARAWEVANPTLVKKNKRRFLNNWLSRAQENAARYPRRAEPKQASHTPAPPEAFGEGGDVEFR